MKQFARGEWLNTPHPLAAGNLCGEVVLIHFWDYATAECVRALQYLRRWHQRCGENGLVVIGVHVPAYDFGRLRAEVAAAAAAEGILYPIVLNNSGSTWNRYGAPPLPSIYLVDAEGFVRLEWAGETDYQEVEVAIQRLLRQPSPRTELPNILPTLREADRSGSHCYEQTADLDLGYAGDAARYLTNRRDKYHPEVPLAHTLPGRFDMEEGHCYLAGFWRARSTALEFIGRDVGRVVIRYRGAGAKDVISPAADMIDIMLGLRSPTVEPLVEVRQDDSTLTPETAGRDIVFVDGRSMVLVDRPRLFELARMASFGEHELELIFRASGLTLYAFSFSACPMPPG